MSKASFAAAAVLALALVAPQAHAQGAKPPRDFLTEALQGDNSEMALGMLAERRAASPQVRRFGRMLQMDHSRARADALPVARRLGVRPTRELAPEARDERQKLMGLRGREFDREFVRYMIDDHEKDVRTFRDQSSDRGPTGRLATRTLPALEKHLHTARDLGRDVGA